MEGESQVETNDVAVCPYDEKHVFRHMGGPIYAQKVMWQHAAKCRWKSQEERDIWYETWKAGRPRWPVKKEDGTLWRK